jgi:phosphoglycerol transferase MdoB-like AlkP superfamily enzyme
VYALLRFVFLQAHSELYQSHSSLVLLASFVHGMRFDIAALCWINALFLIIALTPLKEGVVRTLFYLINGSFIIGAFNDIELFAFNGKRLSMEFFTSLGADFWRQLWQVFLFYWYLPILGILVAALIWWVDKKISDRISEGRVSWKWGAPLWLGLVVLTFIGIRGGLQSKSIHVQAAFIQGANELGHLTLNTPYHFLRTFNTPRPPKKAWFSESELEKELRAMHVTPQFAGFKNHNVVLLILESFSLEYFEEGYTPFLKELAGEGLFFDRHFANGRRSIEVLSSLMDAIPSVQEVPFSKSNAQGMKLEGVATKLKAHGYKTGFFHGATRGSMGFESYALAHGFEHYYAREDYPGPSTDFDGQWGIFDGPFLQFSLEEMTKYREPFFASVFTLSSHQPYTIPKEFQGKFPKGTLEIHESIGYVDAMLRAFFEKAKSTPWYERTVFLITADHTQKLHSKKFQNALGAYRVPFIIYHPTQKLVAPQVHKTTQHVDVPTTILDLVDVSEAGLNLVGESMLTPGIGRALHFLQPGWQYVEGERVVRWVEGEASQEFIWEVPSGALVASEASGMENRSKLFIQYLLNGFRANKWPFVLRE